MARSVAECAQLEKFQPSRAGHTPHSNAQIEAIGLYLRHSFRPHQALLGGDPKWGVGATISFIAP